MYASAKQKRGLDRSRGSVCEASEKLFEGGLLRAASGAVRPGRAEAVPGDRLNGFVRTLLGEETSRSAPLGRLFLIPSRFHVVETLKLSSQVANQVQVVHERGMKF